jgi:predicted AAA+ superfamily ATPase
MDRELLRQIILDQQVAYPSAVIPRSLPYDLPKVMASSHVVILTGVRRCGKSTWLQHCRQQSMHARYYLNFDDDRLVSFELADFQVMLELFIELFGEEKTCFFDEIQNIVGWERFIRRLHDQGYKIYITGSNANMLSQELGTHLTGRYVALPIYPFSFEEYCRFKEYAYPDPFDRATTVQKATVRRHYQQYLLEGGFPEHIRSPMREYLQNLYDSILYRDIVARYKLPSDKPIRELAFYLASHVGTEITYNSLRKLLSVASANTISDYCQYLENTYLCFFVNRFSYSLKQQLQSPKKVYFIDPTMADAIGFRHSPDHGRLLENIVFIELKRRNYFVHYYKGKQECDFVTGVKQTPTVAIQVCFDWKNAQTQAREIAGLVEAMVDCGLAHGVIITGNESDSVEVQMGQRIKSIQVIPIAQWLLSPKREDF